MKKIISFIACAVLLLFMTSAFSMHMNTSLMSGKEIQKILNQELKTAIAEHEVEEVKYWIDKGVKGDDEDFRPLVTAVYYAGSRGRSSEIVKLLLENGEDVNDAGDVIRGISKETILQKAIDKNRKDLMELLLRNGADIYAKNLVLDPVLVDMVPGDTAQEYAIKLGYQDLAKYLQAFEQALQSFLENPTNFKTIKIDGDVWSDRSFLEHLYYGLSSPAYQDHLLEVGKKFVAAGKKNDFTKMLHYTFLEDRNAERQQKYSTIKQVLDGLSKPGLNYGTKLIGVKFE